MRACFPSTRAPLFRGTVDEVSWLTGKTICGLELLHPLRFHPIRVESEYCRQLSISAVRQNLEDDHNLQGLEVFPQPGGQPRLEDGHNLAVQEQSTAVEELAQ